MTAPATRRTSLMIFLCALALRLAWVLTLGDHLTWIDEREFAEVGTHLAAGHGYISDSFRNNPVVPFYLSLAFRVFGQHYLMPRIGQAIVGALTCMLVYRTAASLISPIAGLFAGLLLAIYPAHIYVAGVFYVDAWLMFFCALSVCLAVTTLKTGGQRGWTLLCGVSIGLTALTREAFVTVLVATVIACLYSAGTRWRQQVPTCLVLVAGCLVTILPWTIRNYRVFGRPILVSSGFYTMLWRGNNELATGEASDRILMWNTPTWTERLERLPEDQRRALQDQYQTVDRAVIERRQQLDDEVLATDDVLKPLAIAAIRANPGRTVVLMMRKVRTLFSALSQTETNEFNNTRNTWVAGLSFYPILILAMIGAGLGIPRRRELALLYLVIGAIVFNYALLTACTRFRLPIDPYLIVFASLALETAWAAVTRSVGAIGVIGWRNVVAADEPVPSAVANETGTEGPSRA